MENKQVLTRYGSCSRAMYRKNRGRWMNELRQYWAGQLKSNQMSYDAFVRRKFYPRM